MYTHQRVNAKEAIQLEAFPNKVTPS